MAYSGEVRVNTGMNLDGLRKGMRQAERDVAKFSKLFDVAAESVKKLEKETAHWSNAFELAVTAADKLNRQLKEQREIMDSTRRGTPEYAAAAAAVERLNAQYQEATKYVDSVNKELLKTETALEKAQDKARGLSNSLEDAAARQTDASARIVAEIERLAKQEALKPFREMRDDAEALVEAIKKQGDEQRTVNALLEKSQSDLDAAKASGDAFAQSLAQSNVDKSIAEIERLDKAAQDLYFRAELLNSAFGQIADTPLGQSLAGTRAEMSGLAYILDDATTEAKNLSEEMQKITENMDFDEPAKRVKSSFGTIATSAATAAKATLSGLKRAAAAIGTIAKGSANAAKNILGMAKNMLSFGGSTRRTSRGITSLTDRLGRLALAALVFNQIRKALSALAKDLNAVLMANNDFARSFNAIKVNMLTAFAPIWEIIQPAIITFMQLLAQFTAILARFMATLFGRTYQQAKDSAAAIYDQAKATDKLGASASKAGKQLAKFDEINKQAEDSAGGSAGTEGLDFNIEEPDNVWLSWLDEFAAKLKSIFTEIDPEYWFNLGAALAAWITGALNSIPWGDIQNWAKTFATNLAGFLNGALGDPAMWTAIGHTITQGLNTVLIFLHTMLTGLDFYNIASAIGAGINTAIDELDWNLLAQTIKAGIVGAMDFLSGLLDSIRDTDLGSRVATLLNDAFADKAMWKKVAVTLADGINIAVSIMLDFVRTLDWKEHGAALAAGINQFIKDTNWDDLGALIGESFKGALDYLITAVADINWMELGEVVYSFLAAIDWSGIISRLFGLITTLIASSIATNLGNMKSTILAIGDYFRNIAEELGIDIAGGVLVGIIMAFVNIAKWIYDNVFLPIWNAIKAAFGISSPSKAMAELGIFIMQGLLNGISSLASTVVGLFQKLLQNVQDTWKTVSNWFQFNVVDPVQKVFDAGTTKIRDSFSNLWEKIKYIWAAVNAWFDKNVTEPVRKAFDLTLKSIYDFFRNAWTNIQGIWTAAANWFTTNVTKPIQDAFDTAVKNIKGFFQGLWDFVSGIFSSIGGWISDILDGLSDITSSSSSANKAAASSPRSISAPVNYSLDSLDVPMLARGGIVDSATLAVIGERGREAVVPLENNVGWIKPILDRLEAIEEALRYNGDSGDVTLNVNGRELARATYDDYIFEGNRRGNRIGNGRTVFAK